MNKELTELVFVLDRSGLMGGMERDIILFDDEVEIIYDRFHRHKKK